MKRSDSTRLEAVLMDVETLAMKARLCAKHTFYTSPNPDSMKKYKRSDGDVAKWLDELEAATARLRAARLSIPEVTL